MWERIGASSGIVIGAFVLFAVFVVVLFLIFRADEKKKPKRREVLYLVQKPQSSETRCPANAHARYDRQAENNRAAETMHSIGAKKIV
jgi:hypothetical protein